MKFYDRESELQLLEKTRIRSMQSAKMTVVTGRRRIGKTTLIREAFKETVFLYFFVSRKNEALLCSEFIEEMQSETQQEVLGDFSRFNKLFEYLLVQSQSKPMTLVLDEFQEFYQVNPSVFGDMQNLWDRYKDTSAMNLLICGSVRSLMKKIFKNAKEPLFGRADERLFLKPFSIGTLNQIMRDYTSFGKPDDILAFYVLTGGVAKYVELFADKGCFTFQEMLDEIFRENSLLLDEGKNVLIEEFGRDYATYFSILALIASAKTSRSDIESILEKNIGGYLEKLEKDYQLISSHRPVFSKPGSRSVKCFIDDNFLNFWFRFIYKYRTAIEIGNFDFVRNMVERDFDTFSGPFLEKYFREKLALSGKYSQIGRFWTSRNQNEIDIVAINEADKKALIVEVKRNKNKINPAQLEKRADIIRSKLSGYDIETAGFSLEDIPK